LYEPLISHVRHQAEDGIDIFCFQEVCDTPDSRIYCRPLTAEHLAQPISDVYPARANLYRKLTDTLPDFAGFYRSTQDGVDFSGPVDYELHFGLASFVRQSLSVQREDDVFVFGERNSQVGADCATMGRNMQYVQCMQGGRQVTAANFHGLWHPDGKGDVSQRIQQSHKIVRFLSGLAGDIIIGGDFNMLPDTQSMAMLEDCGLRNMVTEYGIKSTRSSLYTKPEKLGSFVLVSEGIEVVDFQVVQEDVSDHLALQLEFA
jgi:hypothetical protein